MGRVWRQMLLVQESFLIDTLNYIKIRRIKTILDILGNLYSNNLHESFFRANQICESKGSQLIFGNPSYAFEIYELARGIEIWLGLYKDGNDAPWKWINGELAKDINWSFGQPNEFKSNEFCTILMNRHVNDVPCDYTLPFICMASSVTCRKVDKKD